MSNREKLYRELKENEKRLLKVNEVLKGLQLHKIQLERELNRNNKERL